VSNSKDMQRRTVTPSPLSQSTIAVHLQAASEPLHSRKLSKRRTPLLTGLFNGERSVSASKADSQSLLVTPSAEEHDASPLSKTVSNLPGHVQASQNVSGPPSAFKGSEAKREKRGSVLGRLAKRFSVLRKPTQQPGDESFTSARIDPLHNPQASRQPSPEKAQKRVPPPSVDRVSPSSVHELTPPLRTEEPSVPLATSPPQPKLQHDNSKHERRDSDDVSLKLNASFSVGRLMVANPDIPSSSDTTPVQNNGPLPPVKVGPPKLVESTTNVRDELPALPATDPVRRSFTEQVPPQPEHLPPMATPPKTIPSLSVPPVQLVGISQSASPVPSLPSKDNRGSQQDSTRVPVISGPYSSSHGARSFVKSDASIPKSEHRKRRSIEGAFTQPQNVWPSHEVSSQKSEKKRYSKDEERYRGSDRWASKDEERPRHSDRRSSKEEERPQMFKKSSDGHSSERKPAPVIAPAYLAPAISVRDDSQMSRLSTTVNPPTPQQSVESPIPPPSPAPPALPPKQSSSDGHGKQRTPSPGANPVTARETETFKLVRSPSGNVYTVNGEVLQGGGEQWEVVQATRSRDRSNSKSRESEQQKPEERGRDSDRERKSRKKREKQSLASKHQYADTPPTPPEKQIAARPTSLDSASRSQSPQAVIAQRSKSRRREEESSQQAQSTKREPSQKQTRPLERNPSVSARPTSEVPPAADLNALRAKEAWEIERLWKARSMVGMEPDGETPAFLPGNAIPPQEFTKSGAELSRGKSLHGSSHTSYTVQNSFEIPVPFARPNNNPLPDPPRESTYQPAPLSHPLFDPNSPRNSDYWSSHGNVSTAHY
jgi:hypothetical protein